MHATTPKPAPRPNRTIGLVAVASSTLVATIAWSTHHLLLAGAPSVAAGGGWPGVACMLLPVGDDLAPHLASYAFLLAIGAGLASGLSTLIRQRRHTRGVLRKLIGPSGRVGQTRAEQALAQRLGLAGRLDIVDTPTPIAFCYGYLRPRVLISGGVLARLPRRQLAALLLHEREHLRQRDPLKVALGRLLSSAVFFVPAIGALYQRYLIEKELAADAAVIRAQGSADYLAAALAAFLDAGTPASHMGFAAGADDALEARLDALLGDPVNLGPRVGHVRLVRSGLVAILAFLPLLVATPVSGLTLTSHEIVAGCHVRADPG